MSRSVFVSAGGDPFILLLVYKLFKERWYNEVDEFLINYNNNCGVPDVVVSSLLPMLIQDKKVTLIYHPSGIGNGKPITEMTRVSQRDHVMLLEDDGFIFNSGIVDSCFKKIESGETDIVGSPRFSCGAEVGEASAKKYGLDYSGYGDVGPNWWPNFFFCKRKDLLLTDMDFGSHKFEKNVFCYELGHVFKEDNMGDTFVWACVQLRALGLRSMSIPQHKADPYEIESRQKKEMNWHETQKPFDWIHGGSLSTSWGGYLSGVIPQARDDSSLREMETRCAFWTLAADTAPYNLPYDFDLFRKEYKGGIKKLIAGYGLDENNINTKIEIYKQLLRI